MKGFRYSMTIANSPLVAQPIKMQDLHQSTSWVILKGNSLGGQTPPLTHTTDKENLQGNKNPLGGRETFVFKVFFFQTTLLYHKLLKPLQKENHRSVVVRDFPFLKNLEL